MPQPWPEGLQLGLLAPAEAIAAFRARKLLSTTFNWDAIWQEEHTVAFTVAKLMREDLLRTIRDALDEAIATGSSLEEFKKTIRPRMERAGWWGRREVVDPETGEIAVTKFNPARLALIYDVNVRQSYAAGRWSRIEASKRVLPLVIYRTMRDERVRASHKAWDGLVLPVDHPFWETHYPPNGWRCRCTAYALSERDVQRLEQSGVKVRRQAPPVENVQYTSKETGLTHQVPRGIDPGFAYNPGKTNRVALLEQRIADTKKSDPL